MIYVVEVKSIDVLRLMLDAYSAKDCSQKRTWATATCVQVGQGIEVRVNKSNLLL